MQEMRIYLLNNTKPYHDEDDGYSGDWFSCPVDFEEVKEKLEIIPVKKVTDVLDQVLKD